jgi:exocyst complex component 2
MNGGCFKWNGDALPTGIRDYVHEILLYFVQVHAEVSSISEHLTKKVLSQLLEELSFEMLQQFGSVKSFSNPGKLVVSHHLLLSMHTPCHDGLDG